MEMSSSKPFSTKINVDELLEKARKLVDNDISSAEYNINLALLSQEDEKKKIQTNAIRSFINFKSSTGYIIVLHVANKFLKELKNSSLKMDTEIALCYIRSLYRAGDTLNKLKLDHFLSAFFYYNAKKFMESNEYLNSNSDVKNTIESKFIASLEEISKILNFQKENLLKIDYLLEEVCHYIKNGLTSEINSDGKFKMKFNSYFLVSTSWLQNVVYFYNAKKTNPERVYDRKNVCLLYFNEPFVSSEFNKYIGNYPGPINNYPLVDFEDAWWDPRDDESHTNVYLKMNLKENSDFVYLPPDIFEKLKLLFTCNNLFVIERKLEIMKSLNFQIEETILEVHLKRLNILILTEIFSNEFKNFIRLRKIQISKFKTIKDLKTKILCSVYHLVGEFYREKLENCEMKIYIPDFGVNRKIELFQIVYSYVNNFVSYKLKGEEITNDDLLISNLKLGIKDPIIVEIICKSDLRRNPFLNLTKGAEIQCSTCGKTIPSCKIKCEICDDYFYCSEICRFNDDSHKNFHINIQKLFKKKIDLSEIMSIPMTSIIPKGSRGGLTGMKNLGNTCFMNSALQCLSNCEEVTKYFLLKKFSEEINKNNKHGSGGQIAKAYYELVKELWEGKSPYLSPWDFRQIFVGFVKQFAGFSQHDSHEMLAFMLDALHEDLNRVKEKPYSELREKQDSEDDETASRRWWTSHLSRENSIIVDLFHGQYKSVITCPECNRISITYDPFMYLGLPIPNGSFNVCVKVFLCEIEKTYKIIYVNLSICETTTVGWMKKAVSQNLELVNSGCTGSSNLIALVTKDKMFEEETKDQTLVFEYYNRSNEIIFYYNKTEYSNDHLSNYFTFFVSPIVFKQMAKNYFNTSSIEISHLFYPRPFIMQAEDSYQDLLVEIFKFYRKLIKDKSTNTYENFKQNMYDDDYVYNEFKEFYQSSDIPIKLYIKNNIKETGRICEFCKRQDCQDFCNFNNFKLSTPIHSIYNMKKTKRPLLLYAEIAQYNKRPLYDNWNPEERNSVTQSDKVNLYDCLEAFRREEKLEQDNAWYCARCKKHQEANKKLEIYKSPNILIVQLKRFKIKTNNVLLGMVHNKKNDSVVNFPLDNFDLGRFCISDKENSVYELFSVSQHYGSMSSGHYTALCKNKGEWWEFDDDRVTRAEKNVVTPASYILFYRKKML